ncbi:MAG: hypothetical protein SGI77_27085 [Pirellulaceae bacterium]|nr:hypothetical protein [Pirellulaceae bacterium]
MLRSCSTIHRSNKTLAGLVLALAAMLSKPSDVQAWSHHCHSFGHGGFSSWGAYGMGGGFRTSGFGNYGGSFYASSFAPSFGFANPRCLSYRSTFVNFTPSFYSSFYAPSFYSSYYCPPIYSSTYYPPIFYRPVNPTPVFYSVPRVSPIFGPLPRVPFCATSQPQQISTVAVPSKQAPWLASAVELIDLMVQQGGVDEGLKACEHLIQVRDQLPSEIYWRAALLAAVSGREANQIVAFIDRAEKSGDRFSVRQLPGGSLRAYVKSTKNASIDDAMNRLAQSALKNAKPTAEYTALSALLALDGQPSRARVFLTAAANAKLPSDTTIVASLATLDR